jgi:hypothetical protein
VDLHIASLLSEAYSNDILPQERKGRNAEETRTRDLTVPNAAMDATFVHYGQTFTDYVRECFRWGGFPGWAQLELRPKEDLAFLTRELLPL